MSRSRRSWPSHRAIPAPPQRAGGRRLALILGAVAVIAVAGAVSGVGASLLDRVWPLMAGLAAGPAEAGDSVGKGAAADLHPQFREIVTRVTTFRARMGALVDRTAVPQPFMRVMVISQIPDLRMISEQAHTAHAHLAAIEGAGGDAREALLGATDRIGAASDALLAVVTSTAMMPAEQMQRLVKDIEAAAADIAAIDRQSTGGVS